MLTDAALIYFKMKCISVKTKLNFQHHHWCLVINNGSYYYHCRNCFIIIVNSFFPA